MWALGISIIRVGLTFSLWLVLHVIAGRLSRLCTAQRCSAEGAYGGWNQICTGIPPVCPRGCVHPQGHILSLIEKNRLVVALARNPQVDLWAGVGHSDIHTLWISLGKSTCTWLHAFWLLICPYLQFLWSSSIITFLERLGAQPVASVRQCWLMKISSPDPLILISIVPWGGSSTSDHHLLLPSGPALASAMLSSWCLGVCSHSSVYLLLTTASELASPALTLKTSHP